MEGFEYHLARYVALHTRAFGEAPSAEVMAELTSEEAAIEAWDNLHAYLTDCDDHDLDSLGGWSD
jgi:hypothetical protein